MVFLGKIGDDKTTKKRRIITKFVEEIFSNPDTLNIFSVRRFFGLEKSENNASDSMLLNESSSMLQPASLVHMETTEVKHMSPSDFEFLKTVGKGSYGKVFMARHIAEQKIYAIKVLDKSHIRRKNEVQHVMAERNVMVRVCRHPFIVRIQYSFQTLDKLFFVVEFINGGELFYHLQKEQVFSQLRSRFYSAEIVSAISYMHASGIIYRDLKPENILLDSEGHVKLTDFGLCKEGLEDTEEKTSTFCGTPEYLAPEIIRKEPYTKAVDWWCTGAVLYEMLQGIPPFYNKNARIMHEDILKKPLSFRRNINDTAKDLLTRLLRKDGSKRLGSGKEGALEIRRHNFYRDIDWDALEARMVKPPIIYTTTDQTDLRYIDPEFIREPIPASVVKSHMINKNNPSELDAAFPGFTFVNPLNMDKADSEEL
ncbi:hypothetical protein ACOME3_008903 [Neoechinorhynchus agilis]